MRSETRPHSLGNALIFIVWLVGFILLAVLLLTPMSAQGARNLPVALHSALDADYSADPRAMKVQPVDLGLLEEALADLQQTESLPEVISELLTPVPTVTPRGSQSSPTLTNPLTNPTQWVTATQIVSITRTASSPTLTSTVPTPTLQVNTEPVATRPAPTLLPSSTPVVRPTQPPTSPPPSRTPIIPTATRYVPPPTATSAPPPQPTSGYPPPQPTTSTHPTTPPAYP